MHRSISAFGLLFASISAIIGSGWLFACYYSATLAGPMALMGWFVGGAAVIIVAFVFAELCTMLPITGSSARIPQFTHGSVVGFLFAWIIWLSYMAMAPTEVQAVIQYLAFYFPQLIYPSGKLTHCGYLLATLIMALVSIINIYSLRWLMRCNNFLTVIKIIIPVLVAAVLLSIHFSKHNVIHFFAAGKMIFMPYGWQGVFAAISSGGVIFAFNGFKQAAEMAGEAKNPRVALPFAIVGSVVLCMLIFAFLQCAFLAALQPHNYSLSWHDMALSGSNSPLAAILQQDRVFWLLPILYLGAILAPLAAAMMYCSSASRSLYGMSKNGYVPQFFQKLTAQGNPWWAIIVNFIVGMGMFAPLPGWEHMIMFLSSLMAITYGAGPIALLVLRRQLPHYPRPFTLPCGRIWAVLAFYICNLFVYWSGWGIVLKFEIAIGIGLILLLLHHFKVHDKLDWRSSIWIWFYFIGLGIISYFGNFGGGLGYLHHGLDFAVIAIFSLVIAYFAVYFRLPLNKTAAYINAVQQEIKKV